ncbi:sensor histidine kinase [Streptomyces sp. NPDC060334]|uniref:sensor histidine kinase n=1 Tax=unclassified Streptomyces TaxID=2593676 RepID=UPI002251575D|nr:histidine kinase [Streptomyces sp. NBC_00424]MCX5077891.1 histidine kinase [Streptomyces sp. NBC_00424]
MDESASRLQANGEERGGRGRAADPDAEGSDGPGPGGVGPDEDRDDLPAPRLARVILTAALLSYLLITTLNIWSAHLEQGLLVTALTCLTAIFLIQLRHSSPGACQRPRWEKILTLGAQALLTYLPLILFKAVWGAMAGFFAGSLLLLLPPKAAWSLYAGVGLSMLVPPMLEARPVLDSVYLCQSTLLTGLVVFGLTRLADLVNVLHETRGRLARMAVTKERLRFARDLHDLLGYSLSAITLKSEVVRRILPTHPERALEEIREVLEISRQSLSDVRTVASRLRDMSLAEEAESAESLLVSADVGVQVRMDPGAMSRRTDTVLAAVLREAVTNLIRHSSATHCEIQAVRSGNRVRLSVRNDGVDPAYRDPSPDGGTGLDSLTARLGEVGGSMSTTQADEGTFLLVAEADAFPADSQKRERR